MVSAGIVPPPLRARPVTWRSSDMPGPRSVQSGLGSLKQKGTSELCSARKGPKLRVSSSRVGWVAV